MGRIKKFFDWLGDALVLSSHARYGIFVEQPKPEVKKESVGLMFVMDELWPDSSAQARDELIWMTPYPFVDLNDVAASLRAMREKWGPNIADAIKGEMDEFDRIWEETRPQREAWENEGGAVK